MGLNHIGTIEMGGFREYGDTTVEPTTADFSPKVQITVQRNTIAPERKIEATAPTIRKIR